MPTDQPGWEIEGPAGSDRQPIVPSDVNKASRELCASVREARKSKGDPEVLCQKVTDVIEHLQQVTQAMRGGVIRSRGRRFTRTTRNQSGTRAQPDTLVEVAYAGDPSDLLAAADELAKQLRCRSFSEEVLRAAADAPVGNSSASPGKTIPAPPEETDLPGEKAVEIAFEIASYMALRDAGPESWGRKAATVATSDGSTEVKAVVKTVNYLLGPSALTVINDLTKLAGDAVKNINAERLKQSVTRVDTALQVLSAPARAIPDRNSAHQTPSGAPASPSATRLAPPSVPQSVSPPSAHRLPDTPKSPSSVRKHRPPSSPGTPGIR